jgi:hypothetical protein
VTHGVADILRARMLTIACGYEDPDDLDHLCSDPGFKLACGRLPDSGAELCSQPTVSRWENAPTLREVVRMTYALVDIYCASYPAPPRAVTLDIEDILDVVHGHQQLALFNGHYGERYFLPIHVYDIAPGGNTAAVRHHTFGKEIRCHLRRLVRRIRRHWPHTRLTIRGDGYYGRPEVMAWCEANGIDYILDLPGNAVLDRLVELAADDVRVRRAEVRRRGPPLCRDALRRQILALPAPGGGAHRGDHERSRYSLPRYQHRARHRQWLYGTPYCARGQAENLLSCKRASLRPTAPVAARRWLANASRAAHWRLLVAAQAARCHSRAPAAGSRRVHHLAAAADQDRRTDCRNSKPRAYRLRRSAHRGATIR